MTTRLKNYAWSALVAVPLMLLAPGCTPECVDVADCASKGTGYTCVEGACVLGNPAGDAGLGGGGGATGGGGGGGGGGATGGGGGDDAGTGGGGGDDAGTGGGGGDDAGTGGGGGDDAGMELDAGTDAGMDVDAGTDAGMDIDAGTDAGMDVDAGYPALEVATARSLAQGGGSGSVHVTAVTVTYLKPLVGTEPAGFFVQVGATGPAIFVAIDPTTLTPAPAVGDSVSFTATAFGAISGLAQITALADWQRLSANNSVTGFTQDLSAVTGLIGAVNDYESELVSIRGVLDGGFTAAGSGFLGVFMATTGANAEAIRFRTTTATVAAMDLERGCDITSGPTPLWRFTSSGTGNPVQAQPTAWQGEIVVHGCPAPSVVSATAATSTELAVTFSRQLATGSVLADGSQFTFDNGLTATAATVSGRVATVTTSAQGAGTAYTVTVANTVTDTRGTAVGTPNTATFTGPRANVCTTANQVVISQVYGGGGNSGAVFTNDFIELHNRGAAPVDLAGWSIFFVSSNGTGAWARFEITPTSPATTVMLPAGAFFLIQAAAGNATIAALPAPDAVSTLALGGTGFKVALTTPAVTAMTGACPAPTGLVDLVAANSSNCSEGGAAAAAPANATAVIRKQLTGAELSCFDSNDNAGDFVVATPTPRNSSTVSACATSCPGL